MKKVLHISKYYPPYKGGIEDVSYNIVRLLQKHGSIEQKVICFSGEKDTLVEDYDGVSVIRVGSTKQISRQIISLSYYSHLKKLIQSFKPDVIHFHAPNPLVALFILHILPSNTQLIVHWHSDIVAQRYLYKLVKGVENRLLDRANVILATSPNYIEDSLPLQKYKHKIKVFQNFIDISKFELTQNQIEEVEAIKTKFQNKPILFFLGRHVAYKGIQYLIDAEPYIKNDCVFLIGGKGELTDQLKNNNKSERIHFIGRVCDEDLPVYYKATDIFVFPSVTKNEAFGVALAEAMYSETAAVTFTIFGSGVNWVSIHNQTGIEVENRNVKALAEAIDTLLADKELRDKYAKAAKMRVHELFTIEKIEKKLKEIYQLTDV